LCIVKTQGIGDLANVSKFLGYFTNFFCTEEKKRRIIPHRYSRNNREMDYEALDSDEIWYKSHDRISSKLWKYAFEAQNHCPVARCICQILTAFVGR
jgi:hypothetical protein